MYTHYNIKAVYPMGGHYLSDKNHNRLRFSNEGSAKEYLLVNNLKDTPAVSYIIVMEAY